MDITPYLKAKSDQLNADDLLGGDITVQVEGVNKGNSDQPVVIRISGGHCPFKPSKTALRIIAAAWGTETNQWVGRWMQLYRDATVKWAGTEVGGIRIRAMSHLDRPLNLALTETRGKKHNWKIGVLKQDDQRQAGASTANLELLLGDQELTVDDFDRWRASEEKPLFADLTGEQRAQIAGWLAVKPETFDQIRALIPELAGEQE